MKRLLTIAASNWPFKTIRRLNAPQGVASELLLRELRRRVLELLAALIATEEERLAVVRAARRLGVDRHVDARQVGVELADRTVGVDAAVVDRL